MATTVQLSGAGPFEMPEVVDYLGLAYPMTTTLVQVRLLLEGGNELHLPIQSLALDKLVKEMAALHNKKKKN